jgi:hypothetical protein
MRIRAFGLWLFDCLASDIHDSRTGEKIGRAFLFAWGGRIHVIGARGKSLIAGFIPQKRLTYWNQEIGFTTHPEVDFPRIVKPKDNGLPS